MENDASAVSFFPFTKIYEEEQHNEEEDYDCKVIQWVNRKVLHWATSGANAACFSVDRFTQLSVQPLGFAQLWQSVGPAGRRPWQE
jgi:hypothetical protein